MLNKILYKILLFIILIAILAYIRTSQLNRVIDLQPIKFSQSKLVKVDFSSYFLYLEKEWSLSNSKNTSIDFNKFNEFLRHVKHLRCSKGNLSEVSRKMVFSDVPRVRFEFKDRILNLKLGSKTNFSQQFYISVNDTTYLCDDETPINGMFMKGEFHRSAHKFNYWYETLKSQKLDWASKKIFADISVEKMGIIRSDFKRIISVNKKEMVPLPIGGTKVLKDKIVKQMNEVKKLKSYKVVSSSKYKNSQVYEKIILNDLTFPVYRSDKNFVIVKGELAYFLKNSDMILFERPSSFYLEMRPIDLDKFSAQGKYFEDGHESSFSVKFDKGTIVVNTNKRQQRVLDAIQALTTRGSSITRAFNSYDHLGELVARVKILGNQFHFYRLYSNLLIVSENKKLIYYYSI